MLLQFYLLGELRISAGEQVVPALPYHAQNLLAWLLLRPQATRREQMITALYPDFAPTQARRYLSDALYQLRRMLPSAAIFGDREHAWFDPAARWLDVERFRQALAANAPDAWAEGLALYRGDLLPGNYEDWLLEEREALRLDFVRMSQRFCQVLAQQHRYEEALPVAERLVREEPYDEAALRGLMRIYQGIGRRGQALRVYERFVNEVCPELGLPPDPSTEMLAHAIRDASPIAQAAIMPGAASPDATNLLEEARAAFLRGEHAVTETLLSALKQGPPGADIRAARYLEMDLALRCHDIPRVEQLLCACADQDAGALLRRAGLALARKRWSEASGHATEALLAAHMAGDRACEAGALWALACTSSQLGDRAQAHRSAEGGLALARRFGLTDVALDCLLLLARLGLQQGHTAQPEVYLAEALALAQQHGYRVHYAEARRLAAWAHRTAGRLTEARQGYEEALAVYRDVGLPKPEASLLNELAEIYDLQGLSRQSLFLLQQAAAILAQLDDTHALAVNQYNQAYARLYLDDSEAEETVRLAQGALAAFRQSRQFGWVADTLVLIGFACWVDGRYSQALAALQEAHSLHDGLNEWEMAAEINAHLVHAYLGMAQPGQALACSRRAVLSLMQGARTADIKVEVYFAHALALEANGQNAAAIDYLRRACAALFEAAARFQDEAARQALFQRDPITRRLMQAARQHGIEALAAGHTVTRWLASGDGQPAAQVAWTVDDGPPDHALRLAQGEIALRRARLARLIQQAESQGIQPKIGDLAAALGVSTRTIQRDLAHLRKK